MKISGKFYNTWVNPEVTMPIFENLKNSAKNYQKILLRP